MGTTATLNHESQARSSTFDIKWPQNGEKVELLTQPRISAELPSNGQQPIFGVTS